MNDELEAIEMTIEQAEGKVAKAEKWKKLIENPLFKELVTDDYLDADAVRVMIQLKPTGMTDIDKNLIMAKTVFNRFIANTLAEGEVAQMAIDEHRDMLTEVREAR